MKWFLLRGLRGCALAAVIFAVSTTVVGSGQATPQALLFTAEMHGRFVAPAAVDTAAAGKATAVLLGNRLTVHGSFTGLSSPLRDLEQKPNDPGVHMHRGAAGETSPYFHGLQVKLNADGRSGVFFGTTTLAPDDVTRLLESRTYVDIHTVKFGPGEVRDQWRPVDPTAAAARLAALTAAGATAEAIPGAGTTCHR